MDMKSFKNFPSTKMDKVPLILVISFFATCLCDNIPSEFIIGGRDASPGQFPYMVSLRYGIDRFHGCGGGILNPRWVLSVRWRIVFVMMLKKNRFLGRTLFRERTTNRNYGRFSKSQWYSQPIWRNWKHNASTVSTYTQSYEQLQQLARVCMLNLSLVAY